VLSPTPPATPDARVWKCGPEGSIQDFQPRLRKPVGMKTITRFLRERAGLLGPALRGAGDPLPGCCSPANRLRLAWRWRASAFGRHLMFCSWASATGCFGLPAVRSQEFRTADLGC